MTTTTLGISSYNEDFTMPFWHRDAPTLKAIRLDPGFAGIKRLFPASWRELVEVKSLIDSCAMTQTLNGAAERDTSALTRGLVARAADRLRTVADDQARRDRKELADDIAELAEGLTEYATTGAWGPFVVRQPRPREPWLYCGPLGTWAARGTRTPLSFLVTYPDEHWQATIQRTDDAYLTARDVAAEALRGPVRAKAPKPGMYAGRLLLAGGESAFGHKNFAHFVPLEIPGASTAGDDFTVAFTNVHAARIETCSVPLLEAVLGGPAHEWDIGLDEIVGASLTWFRCHDFGHFWRRAEDTDGTGRGHDQYQAPGMDTFEGMALEEAYADTLGLLAAYRIGDRPAVTLAFCAEMLRYLSRRQTYFGDSVSAALEAGWFARGGLRVPAAASGWPEESASVAESLARVVHAVLWETGGADLTSVREALAAGQETVDRLQPVLSAHPTDVTYVFG